jgi:hypothetical protein
VGRAAFKKGSTPRAVAMPSHSPHASHLSIFRAPRMGSAHVAFVSLLEERNLTEVGTLRTSLSFKDFHQAARLHSPTDGHPGW